VDSTTPIATYDAQNRMLSYAGASYMVKAEVTYRILSDHLGSVWLVVNANSGVVRERIDYAEFGRVTLRQEYDAAGLPLPAGTAPFQPFGFAGGLYDADTGLVRFGARDYDPETGRWTAKDPIRFAASLNLYGYALGDPIDLVDPTGLINVLFGVGGSVVAPTGAEARGYLRNDATGCTCSRAERSQGSSLRSAPSG
jgi:RHS repeat-associated protein